MPSLLRDSARKSSEARTRRGSTVRGIAIPCFAPIILIHMHRTLWMWAAIIRTVRRGTPGTALDHSSGGRFSMRYIVTRLFVRQAAISERQVSRSVGTFVHPGSGSLRGRTDGRSAASRACTRFRFGLAPSAARRLQRLVSRRRLPAKHTFGTMSGDPAEHAACADVLIDIPQTFRISRGALDLGGADGCIRRLAGL